MYKMIRKGPRTKPCETPKLSKFSCERLLLTIAVCVAERCTRNSVEVIKSLKENGVISGVERSRQIKKIYDC